MDPEQIFARYRELQQYVGWSDEDARRVQRLRAPLQDGFEALVDDFYAEIRRHPRAAAVITGGASQIERLKLSLKGWLRQLFEGPYDSQHVMGRWQVGLRHAQIGLDQLYANVALSRLRNGLIRAALADPILEQNERVESALSLNRLLDLDLAIIEDSYEFHRMELEKSAVRERSESKFRNLVEAAACMIVIVRTDLTVAYFSPFAERLTGYNGPEVEGCDFVASFVDDPAQDQVRRRLVGALDGTPVKDFELPVRCRDGSQRWLMWNALRIDDFDGQRAALAVGHDITESRRSAQMLVQSERLAAIGQTITGLAHESRNALQRINSCTEMLEFEVEDNEEAVRLIGRLQEAQDDLRRLFDEVRNFAAPVGLDREVCELPGIWREAWELLRNERRGRDAKLIETVADGVPSVLVDRFRLTQVFRNLIENSLAAGCDPLRIEIDCSPRHVEQAIWVEIRICDNGPGLDQAASQKVFQPFFTTKAKGTGLGMAIAHRIVEAHGGTIRVGDGRRAGAEFVLMLPAGHA